MKQDKISELIKKRVLLGDYALKKLPAERQLALEVGVSHMTARRALNQLVDEGFLVRGSNGRLEVNSEKLSGPKQLRIAIILPDFHAPTFDRWHSIIQQAALKINASVRKVYYVHWDDPFILDAIANFDITFLLPSTEPIPKFMLDKLRGVEQPLVVLDHDLSHLGIPSVRLFPPVCVQRLLDHLEAQGHTRIDCFNVQPNDPIVEQRIEQWDVWMAAHGYTGQLINEPVKPYHESLPCAYYMMKRQLENGSFSATALLCITASAAIGAMRALHQKGIRIGQDVAVCTVDGAGIAEFQIPSLTSLEAPDVTAQILTCLNWASNKQPWRGSLLLQPQEVPLQIRESTCPVSSEENTPHHFHWMPSTK
jgi:LacI family transcriptional regulator